MTGRAPLPLALGSALTPRPVAIRSVRRETASVFTWTLDVPDGDDGFSFAPGQFDMLYLFGAGEVAISISGDPTRSDRIVHTIREVGSVTRALGALGEGDHVGLRGPYGRPWPVDHARGRDVLIVAGGLGLAPLRPVVYHIRNDRQAYGRVSLLYGARDPSDLLFRDELEAWAAAGDIDVLVTVDRADAAWSGHVGVVPALLRRARFDAARVTAMLCGPEVMMRFTVRELARLGVGSSDVFVSLERNMKCAVGFCGHCQLGPSFVCKDGPVFRHDEVEARLAIREL